MVTETFVQGVYINITYILTDFFSSQYVAAFKINCKFVFHDDNNEEIQCDGKPTLKYHFQMVFNYSIFNSFYVIYKSTV